MKVKELAERPREKALLSGITALSDTELLALLIESGTKKASAFDLAIDILARCGGISHIADLSLADLKSFSGIKEARALRLLAAIELSRRVDQEKPGDRFDIRSAQDVYQYWARKLRFENQECFAALYLDTRCRVIHEKILYVGGLNASIVHPREVFAEAIKYAANSVAVAHNHPSGDPAPSAQDKEVTEALAKTGEIMQIPLLDHVVIGSGCYFSFREANLINPKT